MKKQFVGIVTARSGSKRIPNKNIRLLNGKPLISWTIEAARKSRYIDRVVVTTDSDEIRKIAIQNHAEAPFVRPKSISSDSSSSESAVLHAIDWFKNNINEVYEYIVLLQPTSPLRNTNHIDEAIAVMIKNKSADGVVSVVKVDNRLNLIKKIGTSGFLETFFNKLKQDQKIPDLYVPNGAIYIIKTEKLKKYENFITLKTKFYLMDKLSSIDIDEEQDFRLAEQLMHK